MGQSGSKAADQGNAVTGRAVGITGGGALKRLPAPRLPQGAAKAKPEDYSFIEVSEHKHVKAQCGSQTHWCRVQH